MIPGTSRERLEAVGPHFTLPDDARTIVALDEDTSQRDVDVHG